MEERFVLGQVNQRRFHGQGEFCMWSSKRSIIYGTGNSTSKDVISHEREKGVGERGKRNNREDED